MPPPLETTAWLTPVTPTTCLFLVSVSTPKLIIIRQRHQNWGAALGLWDCLTLITKPLLTGPKMPNLIVVSQTVPAYVSAGKKLGSLGPAFQGHSRSSELTRIDRVPVISY